MSKKARRRPTWKNNPSTAVYIQLIDEDTDKPMGRIKITNGQYYLHNMLKQYGKIETEKRLRQMFIDLAEQYKGDTL